jgi:HEAT repeat protein
VKRNIAIASGFVCAVALMFVLLAFRTPSYAGKSVDYWMTELTSTNEAVRTNAVLAIRALGPDVIPAVLRRVEARRSVWRARLDPWMARVGLPLAPAPTASALYWEARQALSALGTNANAAIPGLTALLSDSATANRAVSLLKDMNNDVIPALLMAATNVETRVREDAMIDLGYRRINTPETMAILLQALTSDPHPRLRWTAAYAMRRIPVLPDAAIEALAKVLDDPAAPRDLVNASMEALAAAGPRAKVAVPALLRLAQPSSPFPMAKMALTQIDPEAATQHGVKEDRPSNPYE